MNPRFNYFEGSPELSRRLFEFAKALQGSSLGNTILDLVNIRASQINGCAFCVDMHCKEAKIHGEQELRLYHVAIWRESPLFTDRERAALEWTEAVTKLDGEVIPDELYESVLKHFSEQELSELTFAVGVINMWNRLNVSFRPVPGSADEMLGLTKAGLSNPPRSANA
jgi:AhpD family alkylhydroperoxidase